MIRSSVRHLGRGATLAILVLSSLAVAAAPAMAAHTLQHSGSVGVYTFSDTAGSPGARCLYQGTAGHLEFDHMRLDAPDVFWPTADAFPNGTVGWQLRLQHWDGGTWTTVRKSAEFRGLATKTHAAPLTDRSIDWAVPHDRTYRALVRLRWMTPDAETIGSALVRIDHYRRGYDGSVGSSCRANVPTS